MDLGIYYSILAELLRLEFILQNDIYMQGVRLANKSRAYEL